jgi:hypothetical protein
MSSSKLPLAVVWQEGGHLSDEAIVALADDQDLLPADAAAHAVACEDCARRMGEAALLSFAVGGRIVRALAAAPAPVAHRQRSSVPLPLWALVFGVGFVTAGAVPFLLGIGAWLPRVALVLSRSAPVFVHGLLSAFAARGGDALPRAMVSMVALAVLMMSAFAVSRLTPREGVAQ